MDDLYLNNKVYCNECSGRSKNKWHCSILNENCVTVCKCPVRRFDNDADWFPVLMLYDSKEYGKTRYYVPFAMIKEHETQCLANHNQTPERLKERGGLTWAEMWAVVHDIPYWESPYQQSEDARVPMINFTESWKPGNVTESADREFIVPVEWAMSGFVKVKAPNAEAAIQMVQSDNDDISVPTSDKAEYIEGSFSVSGDDDIFGLIAMVEAYTKDYENGQNYLHTLN